MRRIQFAAVFALLFVTRGWARPNKETDGDLYSDDDPEYTDYSPANDEVENTPATGDPPQIASKPVSLRVRVGANVTLPCEVINLTEDAVVTWKKDDEYLYYDTTPTTNRTQRIIRQPDHSLLIIDAQLNDTSDNYICEVVTDPIVRVMHRLRVEPDEVEPLIQVTPGKRVEIMQGESIKLGCKTRLQPPYEIRWSRKGKRLPTGEESVQGDSITIYKATRHHSGFYQCLADNGTPNPPHAAIELIVNYAPEVEVERESVHTGTGIRSDLTCIVHAHPAAKVMWQKNRNDVLPKKGKIIMKDSKSKHTLTIMHTSTHDLGEYTCYAKNGLGEARKNISLTGVPTQAMLLGGEMSKDDSGMILKWRLESYSPITEYRLEYRRKGETDWLVLTPPVTDGKGSEFTVEHPIEGLRPGSYEAILMARNTFGWSPRPVPYTFTGEYKAEDVRIAGNSITGSATTTRPIMDFTALLLVASFYAYTHI
ncbi:protein amalgam isoform X2 [Orussus abietinus]|uniref:protein amalgam isoform X2 n=1 Tax=Orussus abietinus TaxID=222816 RepID=UPI00062550DF|nr:protein amalgam isoform X2 [Orussus abietinus]